MRQEKYDLKNERAVYFLFVSQNSPHYGPCSPLGRNDRNIAKCYLHCTITILMLILLDLWHGRVEERLDYVNIDLSLLANTTPL